MYFYKYFFFFCEYYRFYYRICFNRQVKGRKSDNLERSFKNENESSTVEDYVYKLPPPKSKSEVGLDINCKMPQDLPKDVKTSMDVTIVSNVYLLIYNIKTDLGMQTVLIFF